MKKRVFLLVMIMALICSAAMAETTNNTYFEPIDTDAVSTPQETTDGETYLETEIWLKVTNDVQINATVPLVLVFQTSMQGGEASTATNYSIHNGNTTHDLYIKSITVNNATNNRMTLVPKNSIENLEETKNQYEAWLTIEGEATPYDLSKAPYSSTNIVVGKGTDLLITPTVKSSSLNFATAGESGLNLLTISYVISAAETVLTGETITGR